MPSDSVQLSEQVFPASEIQKMFWVANQIQPENPAHNIAFTFNIKGNLNIEALQKSLLHITNRHDILRSSFRSQEDNLLQIVHPQNIFHLQLKKLSQDPSEKKETDKILENHINRKFELERAPLIRAILLELSESEFILSIVVHQIIFDAQSRNIFVSELSNLYSQYLENNVVLPIEAETQYADFSIQQNEAVSTNVYDQTINFWKQLLEDQSGFLNLPLDFQRTSVVTGHGDRYFFKLNKSSLPSLRKLSKSMKIDLSVFMHSVYYILLYRLSQQSDIVTGVPFENRIDEKNKKIIGCFANMMPLGMHISGTESFTDISTRLQKLMQSVCSNQEVPLSLLLQKIHSKRDAGYNPLFQTGFSFEKQENLELNGLKTSSVFPEHYGSQLDIFLTLMETDDNLNCCLEYNNDVFSNESAKKIAGWYQRLTEQAISNPDSSIDRLSMLSPEDENIILNQWNDTSRNFDLSVCLHHLFEIQADKSPDKIAVKFRDHALTYRELNIQANLLAHKLIEFGVKPDSIVGVYMERSVEMIVSLYAILKAGGAYLPLNPELPEMRISFMTDDAEPVVILTQQHLEKNLPDSGRRILSVNIDNPSDEIIQTDNPVTETASKNLAYCIYTSGSTGKPKGVLISHESICNRLLWMQEYFKLNENDHILQKTPFDFDVSVWEFFWPLIYGATLVVADPGGHRDSAYLTQIIKNEKITIVHFVPAMLDIFLQEPDLTQCISLQYVICSGEALTYTLQERFFSKMSCELYNLYGPTEAAVDVTYWKCSMNYIKKTVPIGFPVSNTSMYILNSALQPVPPGVEGDLYIGGIQLARGYLKRDELTKERFIPDPFSQTENARIYKTGDIARWNNDGSIEYLGRSDFQIKFNGLRIETGEIEFIINRHPKISGSIVTLYGNDENKKLVAYYTLKHGQTCDKAELKNYMKDFLSSAVIPSHFVELESFPVTSNGKINRKSLPSPEISEPDTETISANLNDTEKQILSIWKELLSLDNISINSNFFDIGGTSLKATRLAIKLRSHFKQNISVVKIFQYPTINQLSELINKSVKEKPLLQNISERVNKEKNAFSQNRAVAVIGMSGRFPGAESIEELWENLMIGKETVTQFSRDELDEIDEELVNDPFYIPARGILSDIDKFDAPFFGISPNEALIMDPQQRLMLETAWAALENAGYSSEQYNGQIGVFAGMGDSSYYLTYVHDRPDIINRVGAVTVEIGTEKDHIAPRISFMMDLHGPSLSIHTGCSTALVVVDSAISALLSNQCDMAMAGGIDVSVPQKSGQLYQEDAIFTKDGHCRPFDADASGTMFGEAVGMVVLKRLEDAIADNDTIHAVIMGTAVNHDGSQKASYLAPSVDGQAEVIGLAQARADFHPESIGFIEAHGTATPIGDPIEIEGLTKAFRLKTDKKQYCAVGSIKGNLGHTTNAAGITGLIKTIEVLKHKKIPPSINYKKTNPAIDFINSPFFVNTDVLNWPENMLPARAGVSSFGYCGTNVHAVLQEAPVQPETSDSRPQQLIMLSAKTASALNRMTENFREFLKNNRNINLADAAFTFQKGRNYFNHRKYIICSDVEDAILQTEKPDPNRTGEHIHENRKPQIVFLFPGQGSQYINMGKSLYRNEAVFRDTVDLCAAILQNHINQDIRDLLFPDEKDEETALLSLKETKYTQPAIFIIEYALSQLWMSWGIYPEAMIGHSIGEFVCACVSGIFSLEDALKLIANRGRLMQDLPRGTMLSVLLDADSVKKHLPEDISIAAINAPNLCVISGPTDSIAKIEGKLNDDGIVTRKLHSSHAFHSSMMDPIIKPYEEIVRSVKLSEPKLQFISTVTGKWITASQAIDPLYWANHLRATVKFSNAVSEILDDNSRILLEVGPRSTSATLARQQITDFANHVAIPSLGSSHENELEWVSLLKAIGMLWQWGININWDKFYKNENRRRIPLPSYSFEKIRYWIDPVKNPRSSSAGKNNSILEHQEDFMTINEPPSDSESSQDVLLLKIRKIMEDISGKTIPDTALNTSFAELGFDSLILTQITRNLAKELKVQISFRQLMEKYSSIKVLSEYIQTIISKEILAGLSQKKIKLNIPAVNPADCNDISCAATNSPGTYSNLESIVIRQMNLIERLVTLLEKQEASPGQIREILSENQTQNNEDLSNDLIKKTSETNKTTMHSANPPVPGARLGKDENGNPAWYVPDPLNKGKYKKLED